MAAWSTGGAMSLRIVNMDLCRTRYATLETQNGAKSVQKRSLCSLRAIQRKKEEMQFSGAAVRLGRLSRCVPMACESTSQTAENPSDSKEEKKSGRGAALFTPNSLQVESLVTEICDTTSIAEFKLDFGGFRLYLKRGLGELSAIPQPAQLPPPPPPATVPAVQRDTTETSTSNGLPKTTTSLALLKSKPSSTGVQRFLDSASDQGLAILQSPKVGFFRRSRTVKGKRAPPSCQEKQVVKEGQVLCYIEQLGGEIPIESDVSGEVIKILREDGEPVGYGDALITVLPSFPGIKKLQQ